MGLRRQADSLTPNRLLTCGLDMLLSLCAPYVGFDRRGEQEDGKIRDKKLPFFSDFAYRFEPVHVRNHLTVVKPPTDGKYLLSWCGRAGRGAAGGGSDSAEATARKAGRGDG